jgi:PAS domain S-box-containing protein
MATEKRVTLPPEYDTLHVGTALYEAETGTIRDANTWLGTILKYPLEELRDLSVEEYTANTYSYAAPEFKSRLQASAAGDPQQFVWRAKRSDGELIWIRIHLSRQPFCGPEYVYAEIQDITEYYDTHHRAELFWRVLRHNLRNEATIIAGNADAVGSNPDAASTRKAGETIRRSAEKLGGMAESVKEIRQAVSGTVDRRVRKHATTAVRAVADDIEEKHPSAEITVTERAAMWINVDDAFTNALTHALDNAVVHADVSAPTVDVSVGPSPNTGRVEIRIVDENPAISDAELDALSDPSMATSTSHGSGIGLFVMKWCVESLGGEVAFERSGPRGNVVRFYLPPDVPPDEKTTQP